MSNHIGIMGHKLDTDLASMLLSLMTRSVPTPIIIIDLRERRDNGIEKVMREIGESFAIELRATPPMPEFLFFEPVSHDEACREKYASVLRTASRNQSISGSTARSRCTSSRTKLGRRFPR